MKFLLLLFFTLCLMTTKAQLKPLESGVIRWNDLPVRISPEREARRLFEGTASHFDYLEIHATTQVKGAKPSPAHAQKDIEEIIIVKEGTMKFTMDGESAILSEGSVILVPPLAMQALENVGDGPLTYYVLMYRSVKPMDLKRNEAAGGHLFLNSNSLDFKPSAKGGRISYFDRPSAMCEHLELHVTQLDQKGPSHIPHSHSDAEIVLMIEGDAELTINNKPFSGTAGDLFYVKSEDFHGISNSADKPCKYFALRWR